MSFRYAVVAQFDTNIPQRNRFIINEIDLWCLSICKTELDLEQASVAFPVITTKNLQADLPRTRSLENN